MHDEVIDALADAGIFRMRTPRRYGGYESDTRTLVEVAAELGRADGSIGWTASVYWIPTWMVGLFPDEVQDEVFATPDVRICGTLSPSAMAAPVEGGVVVNGKWGFITGAPHSHWQEIVAVLVAPDAEPMPIMALVPMSDLSIVDDWHTSGLRGTGSVSTVAQDVFVPAERVLPLPVILQGQTPRSSTPSRRSTARRCCRSPRPPRSAPLLGLAKAAQDAVPAAAAGAQDHLHRLRQPGRGAADPPAGRRGEHEDRRGGVPRPPAGRHWSTPSAPPARSGRSPSGRPPGPTWAAAVRLAKEAVDLLAPPAAAPRSTPRARCSGIQHDVQAISLHALMHPDTNAELYGRTLCGQPPNTLYI